MRFSTPGILTRTIPAVRLSKIDRIRFRLLMWSWSASIASTRAPDARGAAGRGAAGRGGEHWLRSRAEGHWGEMTTARETPEERHV